MFFLMMCGIFGMKIILEVLASILITPLHPVGCGCRMRRQAASGWAISK
jgi:hypothetical protein